MVTVLDPELDLGGGVWHRQGEDAMGNCGNNFPAYIFSRRDLEPTGYAQTHHPPSRRSARSLQDACRAAGLSLNKLFEEFSTKAIAEFDTENRFRARAARGDKARGLEILDEVERKFAGTSR
jgi:hypothetical protein